MSNTIRNKIEDDLTVIIGRGLFDVINNAYSYH